MRAWYIIGIVTALIPLMFRLTGRLPVAVRATGPASESSSTGRRAMLVLFLGALGLLVFAWTATPPLSE